jgi:hypothetical protein
VTQQAMHEKQKPVKKKNNYEPGTKIIMTLLLRRTLLRLELY